MTDTVPVRVVDFRGTYKGGGGPDKTILLSAARHDRRRVDILVVYIRQPHDKEFQIPSKAEALGIRYVDFLDRNLLDFRCLWGLRNLLVREGTSLLHSHDDKTLLYSVLLKIIVPGLRIVHTCHSHSEYAKDSFGRSSRYYLFRFRKKILIWLMRRHRPPVVTISEDTRRRLIRGGLKPENVLVLYNGIDTEEWRREAGSPVLREELRIGPGDLLVGTVARITYDKDLPTFFKVVAKVAEQVPHVRFVIVGDGYGNELEDAKTAVDQAGLSQIVHFTGHRTDLLNIYCSFDLFLMTSVTEGLPNTVLEAMALEIPVVSTRVGGVPELVVDGQTGCLCPVGDAESIADAVCRLLESPALRREMGRASRNRVSEKFDFSDRVKMLEDIYCSC